MAKRRQQPLVFQGRCEMCVHWTAFAVANFVAGDQPTPKPFEQPSLFHDMLRVCRRMVDPVERPAPRYGTCGLLSLIDDHPKPRALAMIVATGTGHGVFAPRADFGCIQFEMKPELMKMIDDEMAKPTDIIKSK